MLGFSQKVQLTLVGVSIRDKNNEYARIFDGPGTTSPRRDSRMLRVDGADLAEKPLDLTAACLDVRAQSSPSVGVVVTRDSLTDFSGFPYPLNELISWLRTYLVGAFFFSPFRRGDMTSDVIKADQLAPNGANLTQVLDTLAGRNRKRYLTVESFVRSALPDLGELLTTFVQDRRKATHFQPEFRDAPISLADMGAGVEQLIMIAVVLLSTPAENPLFIDEPETHLHPGAQRFLIEKLREQGRQVFIATRSPIFLNAAQLPRPESASSARVFQTLYKSGRTTVQQVSSAPLFDVLLEDIGARNSDVLLSEAVLFVEGPTDEKIFTLWSERLGHSFLAGGVTVIPTRGSDHLNIKAEAHSDLLAGISAASPVPFMFVFDADERRREDVEKLKGRYPERMRILQRRELENYLLVPRAILAAWRLRVEQDCNLTLLPGNLTESTVEGWIQAAADALRSTLLIKRIRVELGGLPGGFIPRDERDRLLHSVDQPDFGRLLAADITTRIQGLIEPKRIEATVAAERARLETEWADVAQRRLIAPGDEILEAVYGKVKIKYDKRADAVRIAREMTEEEIPIEVREIIEAAAALPRR